MKIRILLLLFLMALLMSACATIKPVDKISLLSAELDRWQNFSADGIIRATHSGLTLHKNFVLAKTTDSARLDVLGGGAFGISPSPLVSVYLADYLAIESTLFPQLQSMAKAIQDPSGFLSLLSDPEALIGKYGQEIASTQTVDVRDLRISFSPKMKLQKIVDLKSGAEISVNYNAKGDPDKVLVSISKNSSVELLVDKISYGNAELAPLPRPKAKDDPDSLTDSVEQELEQP